ncbi:phosphoribosylaminoimidazolesuccinocarboxamide synthase [Falsibacillus albus]|uniref:Phosphoribosylaminoimidazole-succinocarboxamide synthase n=1 Tax=Falsibacillus albus TaxID=2478915 RepID=A0A3L7JIX9_9BACI|nr:phosphoribosylaminoimidazolesuccinocarboxamide synthase [Falsibacillus albus]RLQ90663.1 phosphoribosylaminoimidazolesuccinocarboxamide synthase [Falsibacillus albus]
MEKRGLLYEGKAKKIFATSEENVVWVQYKNSATAFNGEKKAEIEGKATLNNEISSFIFSKLREKGIQSHFIEKLSATEQLVRKVSIISLEVVTRNVIAGSLSKRLGIEEGTVLEEPIVELYYKDDDLGDPLITDEHVRVLKAASLEELAFLKKTALEINEFLKELFLSCGVKLIDFKLEFGKDETGSIMLADEISPDTCRLWDLDTNEKMDKDVFRRDLGSLTDAYKMILNRLRGESTHV